MSMPQGMGNYYFNSMKVPQNQNFNPYQQQNYMQGGMYPPKMFKKPLNEVGFRSKEDEMNILQSLKYVQEIYPQLMNININNKGFLDKVSKQANPKFFVIKSFTEEDIHKVRIKS